MAAFKLLRPASWISEDDQGEHVYASYTVPVREDQLLPTIDNWLGQLFGPGTRTSDLVDYIREHIDVALEADPIGVEVEEIDALLQSGCVA